MLFSLSSGNWASVGGDAGFLRRVQDEETEDVPAGFGSVAEGPQ